MKLNILPPDDDDAIDFLPWINVVFLCFLFFMISQEFVEEAKGYELTLPTATASQTVLAEEIDRVSYTANGEIWYRAGAAEVQVPSLSMLEKRVRERADASRPILLRCDRACSYEQFIFVKNALLNAGVQTIFEEVLLKPGS